MYVILCVSQKDEARDTEREREEARERDTDIEKDPNRWIVYMQ